MKLIFKSILIICILIFGLALFVERSFASSLYLSPSRSNIPKGGILSIKVNLNTGGDIVNAVSAFLAYPQDKLEVAWINYSNTFSIAAENTYGGGSIKISRGNINPVSGNVNIATIGFKGKTEGNAAISFLAGSAVPRASDSSDSLNLESSTNGIYTITPPAKVDTSPGVTQQVSSTTQDTTPPQISNIEVRDISSSSVTISWKTNEKADSYIEYGLEKDKYFINASDPNFILEHELKLEGPLLTAGAKLHFRILSKDESGNLASSDDATFQLSGYRIKLKILDERNNPIKYTKVKLFSEPKEGKTDRNGEVLFDNVTAGKHLILVSFGIFEKTAEIDVNDTKELQSLTIKVQKPDVINFLFIGIALLLVVILIITGIFIFKRLRKKELHPKNPLMK